MEPLLEPVVSFHSVSKIYGHGAGAVQALDDVTVVVPRGGFTAVMGPSGSGKSTFMNLAAGLDDVTSGEVLVAGQPLHLMDDRARTVLRRTHVGFVFQSYNLVPTLDVRENVLLPFELAGHRLTAEERGWLDHLLDVLGLVDRVSHRPGEPPAASSSAWPSPGRWHRDRPSYSPTSRPATSTPAAPARCSGCFGRRPASTARPS